ncbi:MAG TPA: sodium:proton antiporter [Candidatus Eisenbacteria bacterium]|nr:sodium:proton antiporter [Candidatus Eisenbacteria bacterium]
MVTEGGTIGSAATLDAIRVFVALVAVAALAAIVVRRLKIPYTLTLVVLGLIAASVLPRGAFSVTPELVLLVLVPGLVFEAALRIEFDELRRTFGGIALLAAPGVIITAAIVALILNVATGLPPALGFVVGAMVAATDPVAVLAEFRHLGTPRRLATLVEGESLFNDGTALAVFVIAVQAVQTDVTWAEAVVSLAATVAASLFLGLATGWLASRVIASVDDHLIELTVSLAAAYGTYLLADAVHWSGIVATVVAGVVIGNYGRKLGMSPRTEEALDFTWEFMAYLLTAFAFLLVGASITVGELVAALPWIAWGVIAILVGRAVVIYGLLGGVSRLPAFGGAGRISIGWLHVLFWAGLRGAVAVAMALSLPVDFPQRALLQQITFGIVLFTLFVQGSTAQRVVVAAKAVERPEPLVDPVL